MTARYNKFEHKILTFNIRKIAKIFEIALFSTEENSLWESIGQTQYFGFLKKINA